MQSQKLENNLKIIELHNLIYCKLVICENKRHAWKACIRLKRIGGSNPPLSAKLSKIQGLRLFLCRLWIFCFDHLCTNTTLFAL